MIPALPKAPPDSRIETLTWIAVNLAAYLIVFGFVALFLIRFWTYGDFGRRTLFFVRAVDLSTGLSPVTPLFFVCLGYAAWGFFQLKRTHIVERFNVPMPYPGGESFRRLHTADSQVRDEVSREAIALQHAKPLAAARTRLADSPPRSGFNRCRRWKDGRGICCSSSALPGCFSFPARL